MNHGIVITNHCLFALHKNYVQFYWKHSKSAQIAPLEIYKNDELEEYGAVAIWRLREIQPTIKATPPALKNILGTNKK